MRVFLLTVVCAFAACVQPSPASDSLTDSAEVDAVMPEISRLWEWSDHDRQLPQSQRPVIVSCELAADGRTAEICLENRSGVTLTYAGYSVRTGQNFLEVWFEEGWKTSGWDWCGTGMQSYEFQPGATLTLSAYLPRDEGRARCLTGFRNPATGASSLVVLVERSE